MLVDPRSDLGLIQFVFTFVIFHHILASLAARFVSSRHSSMFTSCQQGESTVYSGQFSVGNGGVPPLKLAKIGRNGLKVYIAVLNGLKWFPVCGTTSIASTNPVQLFCY